MKLSKIIAGMSALSIAAAMAAVPAYAEEASENTFYPAAYDVTYVYSGEDIAAVAGEALIDPTEDDVKDKKAQLVGYTDPETGEAPKTYNLGFNIQVGHMNNAKLTIEVTSSANNIYDGTGSTGSGYMYTVQPSWNGNSPKDDEQGWKKYEYEDDGTTQKMAWGACDINNMSTGKGKFNGEWAQITLTDTNVAALTFTVHVDCSESSWEYHPWTADDEGGNVYEVFSMAACSVKPNNNDLWQENEQGFWGIVAKDEINKQIPGGVTSEGAGGDSSAADSSSTADSNTSSTASTSSTTSTASTTSTTNSKSSTTTTTSKTTSTATTTTTASTTTAASDNTENAASGAAASVGLAIAALAGAALVVSRKR